MVNRVQTLRSSTRGNRPTGRSPGELWVTYPDNAFGVVDAGGVAFDLLAVRFFSSLATYVVGDYVKQGTQLYRCTTANGPGAFVAGNWSQIQSAADGTYIPIAGGTMTGPLVLNAEPSAALGAATKQTVDLKATIASPFFTGNPQAPTPAPGNNTASLATTSFVTTSFAPLASPVFTGNPQAPTPAAGDADTSIATTAFVANNSGVTISDTAPATPPNGKLWFDSISGSLYVSYDDGSSQQWVVANNVPADLSGYAPLAYVDSRLANTSYRNLLRRNGGFEVWQRGAGPNAVIACPAGLATYTADGWYLYVPANEASTVSIQGPVGRFGSQYSAKVQRNAGQTGVGQATFGFPLDTDELYPMQGKFVRLSFMAQAGANWSPASGNLSVLVVVGTGAPQKVVVGFTGAVGLINAVAALTASPTRFQFNASVACPTNASQAEVYFQYTPVGTAGADDSFYIDDVQLEIVPAATGYVSSDFERLNFQEQLLLCQRHYQKTFPYETAPAFNSSTEALYSMQPIGASVAAELGTIRLPVPMRVGFTGVIWNIGAANNQIRNVGLGIDWSVSQLYTGRNVYRVGGTTPAGSALYQTTGYQATMDAGI